MEPVIKTSRLFLRELYLTDLDFVASLLAHPQVMRFYPHCYSRDEALSWLERQRARYAAHRHGFWLAVESNSQLPVGQVGLLARRIEGSDELEIAYLFEPRFWGQGFATEAAAGVRDYAFSELGRSRVISLVQPDNQASANVARRIGMVPGQRAMFHGYAHIVFSVACFGRWERYV